MDPMMISTILSALGSGGGMGGGQQQDLMAGTVIPPIPPPGGMSPPVMRPRERQQQNAPMGMMDMSMLQRIFGNPGKTGPNMIPFAGASAPGMSQTSFYGA